MIHILQENENIDGSPFTVRVYDPGRVKVFGLQDCGETGGPIQFSGLLHTYVMIVPLYNKSQRRETCGAPVGGVSE